MCWEKNETKTAKDFISRCQDSCIAQSFYDEKIFTIHSNPDCLPSDTRHAEIKQLI